MFEGSAMGMGLIGSRLLQRLIAQQESEVAGDVGPEATQGMINTVSTAGKPMPWTGWQKTTPDLRVVESGFHKSWTINRFEALDGCLYSQSSHRWLGTGVQPVVFSAMPQFHEQCALA
jgi:hypothetical protein